MRIDRYRPVSWLRRTFNAEALSSIVLGVSIVAFGLFAHWAFTQLVTQ